MNIVMNTFIQIVLNNLVYKIDSRFGFSHKKTTRELYKFEVYSVCGNVPHCGRGLLTVLAFIARQFIAQLLNGRGFRRFHADIAIDRGTGFDFEGGCFDFAGDMRRAMYYHAFSRNIAFDLAVAIEGPYIQ